MGELLVRGRFDKTGCLERRRTVGPRNSGTLCTYYPGPGMFPLISAIFCAYFPINGPEHGKPHMVQENSDINYRYISQIDRYRWNNAILCTYFL
ncbi:MAG: hypothetical protein E6Z15_18095, partial [Paenibacillus macerans]|nr:hypothetical protein [Paenibacillus macerans]